jgi:RNA polymerase sigma-70 factor (ECF subfamily)
VLRRLEGDRLLQPLEDEEPGSESVEAVEEDPLGDLTRAERLEALRRAVLTLPIRYREAVVLCDLQELSYVEAAEAMGCAVGTVRSRLHRGRALLASKLTAAERIEPSDARTEQPARPMASPFRRIVRNARNLA